MDNFKDIVVEQFKEIGIDLTDEMFNAFEEYYQMLLKRNMEFNLTAITEKKDVFEKHFLDSVLPHALLPQNGYVCDIGAGAGFPSLPLKIVRPDLKFVLIDSLNKRVSFLNEVCDKLNLKDVKNVHARAEDAAHKKEHRERFDCCVARGVAKINTLSEYCLPFLKNGGKLIAYKSKDIDDEINESGNALKLLGDSKIDVKWQKMPKTDILRSFVVITKVKNIDIKYPRSQNKPKTHPL